MNSASDKPLMSAAVLIPAYKPARLFLELLWELSASPVARIIVVNDGSPPEYQPIFEELQTIPKVHLLIHSHNQGKGAALKTGLRYLAELPEPYQATITADADGQHHVEDILLVAQHTLERPQALTLGGRRFDQDVPWKSMFGNTLTRWTMRLFFGIRIYDSQTGLRGIPAKLIPPFVEIPFDRFEYEQEMLMLCARRGIPMHEVTIRTIYFDQNRATHFHPFRDSARVIFVLFRFRLAWLFTWLADYLLFALSAAFLPGLLLPSLLARLAAVFILYPFITMSVFPAGDPVTRANARTYFWRFTTVAMVLGVISALLLDLLQRQSGRPLLVDKATVEIAILFVFFLLPKSLKQKVLPA